MAIQDCTMALYYCPPKFKFKAYYRRGIALARLQLWKKAILGQYYRIHQSESSLSRSSLQISNKLF